VRQRTQEANAAGITLSSFRGRPGAGGEVKALLAREDRRLEGVSARRIGCRSRRTTPRSREARFPWQRGAWTGTQAPWCSQGLRGAGKASITGTVVAKPRRRGSLSRVSERAPRGEDLRKMEGIPGRLTSRSFTRAVLKATLAALGSQGRASVTWPLGEATGMSEARHARIATGRKRPPR